MSVTHKRHQVDASVFPNTHGVAVRSRLGKTATATQRTALIGRAWRTTAAAMSPADEFLSRAFADTLRAAIRDRGLSDFALAQRAYLSGEVLQRLTAGTAAVTLAQVFRLAEALDVNWAALMAETRARASELIDNGTQIRRRSASHGAQGGMELPLSEPAQNYAPVTRRRDDPDVVKLTRLARTLSPDARRVLTLRKVYGLSYPEIATQLSISVADVERHLATVALTCVHTLEPDPRSPFWARFMK